MRRRKTLKRGCALFVLICLSLSLNLNCLKYESQLISIERASKLLCENIPALKRLPAGRATAHLEDVIDDYDDDHDDVIYDNYQFLICSRS